MKMRWVWAICLLLGTLLQSAEPAQGSIPALAQESTRSGLLELAPSGTLALDFPAIEGDGVRVLRFQARINGNTGWKNSLAIKLNGKSISYGILNRPTSFFSKVHGMAFLHLRGLYAVFFTRNFQSIDPSIVEKEHHTCGTWLLLDCGKNLKECHLEFQNKGKLPILLQNVSMGFLHSTEREALLKAQMKTESGDIAATLALPDTSQACKTRLENAASLMNMQALSPHSKILLELPAELNGKAALRFQARIDGDSGWNNALKIKVNGRPIKGGLLNRSAVFSSKSWKNQSLTSTDSYTVFFSRSFTRIDPSILDEPQKAEATWMLLDCGDIKGKATVEFENCSGLWLLIQNVTIGNLPQEKKGAIAEGMKLLQGKKVAENIVLKQGESVTVKIPVGKPVPGYLPVLRFRSRLAYKEVEGWGNYLFLKINGEPLTEQDKYAESRLLNRGSSFAAKGWPDRALANGANFLVFFTNDWDTINPVWVADERQRRENTWFVLRMDELLKWNAENILEFKNLMKLDNFPWNVEVTDVEFGWYRPEAVQNAEDKMPTFKGVATWKKKGLKLDVSKHGALSLQADGLPRMLLESSFSYPNAGEKWNGFHAAQDRAYLAPWKPEADARQTAQLLVSGKGKEYSITRKVTWHDAYLELQDTYSNMTDAPVGIIARHKLYLGEAAQELRFGGVKTNPQFPVTNMGAPSNPTIFAGWKNGGVGVFAVDTISRMQICTGGGANSLTFGTEKLALDPKASHTLSWRIYFQKENDYWSFINRLRRDLNVNYTIPGYGQFTGGHYQRIDGTGTFVSGFPKALGGKRPRFIISVPWFCYYDGSLFTSAEQWLEVYRKTQAHFDKINTWGGKLIPSFETSIQPLPKSVEMFNWPADADKYPTDCIIVEPNGKYRFTNQWTVGRPVRNYRSYILEGTKYYEKIFAGIKGALDAGAGGIYFDIFAANPATYDRKDGATGEIDPKTYELKRQYALGGILEESTKRHLVEYIHSRGGDVICNGFPGWASMVSMPIFAFYECNDLDFGTIAHGHLSTPIGLSLAWVRSEKRTGADLIKVIRGRLSNGGLFYAYITELVEGHEAYEALNRMYPITIEELHPGWIRGKERLITSLPEKYDVNSKEKPEIYLFDAGGKRITLPETSMVRLDEEHWRVDLTSTPPGMLCIIENK